MMGRGDPAGQGMQGCQAYFAWRSQKQGSQLSQCTWHVRFPAGVAHGAWDNELDALAGLRELLSFLPLSNRAELPRVRPTAAVLTAPQAGQPVLLWHLPLWPAPPVSRCQLSPSLIHPPQVPCSDPADRHCPFLDYAVPSSELEAYDMLGVVQQVVDDGQVFEVSRDYAKNIITGRHQGGSL